MIKLPIRVSGELAERVEKSYADAIERVGEAEAIYVRSKLPKVVADLQRGTQTWQAEMAATAKAIFDASEDAAIQAELGESTKAALMAALFYLCNPYDIIPDRVRGTGFVDDAVVLNSCLRRVEKEAPELFRQLEGALRSSRR